MSPTSMDEQNYRRELGNGLVLRWSTATDIDALVDIYTYVFRQKEADPRSETMTAWVKDMMSGRHPLITPKDFAVVEDTERGMIVAATCLLQQPADFGGIPLMMGRPEIVAAHPEYRNRGLIRSIFELIHARSAARGDDFQGITGISYYYRQFGYEYATPLGGGRDVGFSDVPKLKEGETEAYALRAATMGDLPLLLTLAERERTFARRTAPGQPSITPLLTVPVSQSYWRWTLDGMSPHIGDSWKTLMIVNTEGRAVGYVLHFPRRWGNTLGIRGMMIEPGLPFSNVLPSVLRTIQPIAAAVPAWRADAPPACKVHFSLFAAHPVYEALGESLSPGPVRPYAWYIRVPDLPGFLRKIAPVLERRLADSVLESYTGELKIDFYRGGLRLAFERGRLVAAEDWRKPVWEGDTKAGFPPLSFLQLVFGYRSLAAMREALPDVNADDDAMHLLNVLFPPQPSFLSPLD